MRVCSYCHLAVAESDATCPHEGSPLTEVQPVRVPGGVHARFPAVEPFARGSTGGLFLAVQAQSGYRGMLKILAPELLSSQAERSRLKRELRKQTALTHNALTRIIDGGEAGNDLWLFREYIQGESLAIVLRRQGALRVSDALAITAQIASALDELHRQGLLHRDVKPGHVLLSPRPDAVPLVSIIDACIAARLPSGSVFELLGTPAYVAPELLTGKPASFRSDLYSLGCVMYEMLTGSSPFARETVEATLAAHRDLEAKEPDVELPAPVRSLLTSLLAKEPRKRPFSAQQVRRALDPHLPPTTPEPSSGSRTLAGTVSAPPPAAGRVSSAVPLPGARSPAPQAPAAPAAVGGRENALPKPPGLRPPPVQGGPAGSVPGVRRAAEVTREIDLETDVFEAWPDQNTEEIEVMDLDAERPRTDHEATVVVANPMAAMSAVTEDDVPVDVPVDEPAAEPTPAEATPAAVEPSVDSGALAADVQALSPLPAETAPEALPRSGRPVVDFDVESLFNDGTEPGKPVVSAPVVARPMLGGASLDLQDAPTGLYIPPSEPPPPSRPSSAAPLPPKAASAPRASASRAPSEEPPEAPTIAVRAQRDQAEREAQRAARDPEGTVVMQRIPVRPRPPIAMIAGTVVATLIVFGVAMRTCGDAADTHTGSAAHAPEPAPTDTAPQTDSVGAKPADVTPTQQPTAATQQPAEAAPEAAPPQPAGAAPAQPAAEAADEKAAKAQGKASARPAKQAGVTPYRPPPTVEPGVDYKARALKLYQSGKYREAALEYEKATQTSPSDAGAFAGLGASWLSAGQPDRSILAYQRAVQLKPGVSGFHAALGRAYMQKNDRGRAAAAYRKAAEIDPSNQAAQTALRSLGQ